MSDERILVLWYSRSGGTRRLGECIARQLGADYEELRSLRKSRGALDYLTMGLAAKGGRDVPLGPLEHDLRGYGLVVLGTPVHGRVPSAAMQTFLREHGAELGRVAFFATGGNPAVQDVFARMQSLCGQAPCGTLYIPEASLETAEARAAEFAATLRR